MKLFYFFVALLPAFFLHVKTGCAQTGSIVTGKIYTLKVKSANRLLDLSNASMENGANIDCWTNTGSDAERWVITDIGKNEYTLRNMASGKLLHTASNPADAVNVDQHSNTGGSDVKWRIEKAGGGYYYLRSAADPRFWLHVDAGGGADGMNVNLSGKRKNAQRWALTRVSAAEVAPALSIADKTFDAWYTQFNLETAKGFWDRAEMIEILLDAYEVTQEPRYISRFKAMYRNFIADNKSDWMYNKYNDDITWAVLFCVRAYLLTGNKVYLKQGKDQFDKMYARAFTHSFGGGLIWYETKTSKNACINGPAMVAACYLAQATGDSTYYAKAIGLYKWSKKYLFDAATGKVNDNVNFSKSGQIRISTWSSTYNQGTYLGAATMLFNYTKDSAYLSDAEKIAQYTRDSMYHGKVINNEDGGNDLPGFKGIFVRYARKYTNVCNRTDLVPWLKLNARTAYNNRNSRGLIQTKWATRTSEQRPRSAFGASTAVSLFMNSLSLGDHQHTIASAPSGH